jgi:hypothetical protein
LCQLGVLPWARRGIYPGSGISAQAQSPATPGQLRVTRQKGRAIELSLRKGDRVCIVGGGPAGSFSALHLLRLAREQGLGLEVVIYEQRDFFSPGAAHNCKGCAGILSAGGSEQTLLCLNSCPDSPVHLIEISIAPPDGYDVRLPLWDKCGPI